MGYWGASFVAALGVLFAIPSIGADGDACTAGATWVGGKCTILCDSDTADGTCGPILLGNPSKTFAFELQANTGCTAGDAKIYSKSLSVAGTRPWHEIGNIDLDSEDTSGTSMIFVDGGAAAPMRYVKAVITSEADCSNATVVIHQK